MYVIFLVVLYYTVYLIVLCRAYTIIAPIMRSFISFVIILLQCSFCILLVIYIIEFITVHIYTMLHHCVVRYIVLLTNKIVRYNRYTHSSLLDDVFE